MRSVTFTELTDCAKTLSSCLDFIPTCIGDFAGSTSRQD